MRPRMLTALAVIALALSVPVPALANADVNHVLRLWAEGANLYADDCPLSVPDVDTACTAYTVFYAREDLPEGGLWDPNVPGGRAKAPFYAAAFVEDVVVHPDGTADVSLRGIGDTFDTSGTYDKTHLTGASVVASIPLSDGSVFAVNLRWAADGTVEKFGNSGPLSDFEFFPRHFRDDCTTANFNDHQKFVHADATGTIGGIDIGSFGYRDAHIFNNWFHWTVVTHGNCTG